MKAVINWIFFIPVLVLAVVVELFVALNPATAEGFFGMDVNAVSEVLLIAIVALFAVMLLLSFFDRRTSPVHVLRHNYPAGISGVLAAFGLAASTASSLPELFTAEGFSAINLILALASALAAVALLVLGINHCTASNTKSNLSILYLSIPLWCAVHLLSRFMSHTAQPVAMSETMDLVMYVFMAIFFMYSLMVVSLINGKNPVKASIYWGAPAAVSALVYGISSIGVVKNSEAPQMFDYFDGVVCICIGLYILSFVAELSFMSKTKEQQYVLEPEKPESPEESQSDNAEDYVDNDDFSTEVFPVDVPVQEEKAFDESPEEDVVETEISETMKKYFEDISSVESEIEPEIVEEELPEVVDDVDITRDYGSYFDDEVNDDMHIEDENLTVDTTKKYDINKNDYPVTKEQTLHEPAIRDSDYIVGINDVTADSVEDLSKETSKAPEANKDNLSDNYESRLDEIDRLIISIQGGDQNK